MVEVCINILVQSIILRFEYFTLSQTKMASTVSLKMVGKAKREQPVASANIKQLGIVQ